MPAADHRLTTREMARFVAEGFLRFDALIPADLNVGVIEEMARLAPTQIAQILGTPPPENAPERPASSTPLSQCYSPHSMLGEILRLPEVQGIITSLVGPDPFFDHDHVHLLPAGSGYEQALHVDAIVDSRDPTFDVQLFYFPGAVAPGGGGTRFVPGTHLRCVRAEGVSRYQHVLGEMLYTGPPGTLIAAHHGLWHCGRANTGTQDRWMYKVRLNPSVPQVRLWNTDDFDALQNDPSDHVFARRAADTVATVLRGMQPWQTGHEARYEQVARTRLWRYLTGDDAYDVDYYLTRLEQRARLLRSSH